MQSVIENAELSRHKRRRKEYDVKVYLIGCGPGAERCLTQEAHTAIVNADLVVATPRLCTLFEHVNKHMVSKKFSELAHTIREVQGKYATVAVLLSGDSGFFSAAKTLRQSLVGEGAEVINLCGLNSLQYLCSRVGISYERVTVVSAHGRQANLVPAVAYNPYVFALSGGAIKAHSIIARLVEVGLGDVQVFVGENLSAPHERILEGTATSLVAERFDDLTCLLIRNKSFVPHFMPVRDADILRGKVPMTKQAVRDMILSALAVHPTDTVLDIGAGTGAVTVALARQAYGGQVIAIEKKELALELIHKNRLHFGAYNITIVKGTAPECLCNLTTVNKAFIGGSSGQLFPIIQKLLDANPYMSIVATAIALESLHEAIKAFTLLGREPQVMCVNVSLGEKVGQYHLMKAENPIYIITSTPTSNEDPAEGRLLSGDLSNFDTSFGGSCALMGAEKNATATVDTIAPFNADSCQENLWQGTTYYGATSKEKTSHNGLTCQENWQKISSDTKGSEEIASEYLNTCPSQSDEGHDGFECALQKDKRFLRAQEVDI